MYLERTTRLSSDQVSSVLSLVERATDADAVAALSEHVLLSVRDSGPEPSAGVVPVHLLAMSAGQLLGYAHLTPSLTTAEATEPATGELVVEVSARRRGVGRLLLDGLGHETLPLQVWAHGRLPAARALASREGFTLNRELWQLRRPLDPKDPAGELDPRPLPEGFSDRAFVVGQDEPAWLAVNARAFAHYPEQGGMTRHDLDQRIAEPWFDAEGFRLVEDEQSEPPVLAAFHWTKVHGAPSAHSPDAASDAGPSDASASDAGPSDASASDASADGGRPIGEVYVVGVDPAYQGRGLGGPVTTLGLKHLQDGGLTSVLLYVDSDNVRAIATYRRLGFTDWHIDALYLRTESA